MRPPTEDIAAKNPFRHSSLPSAFHTIGVTGIFIAKEAVLIPIGCCQLPLHGSYLFGQKAKPAHS